MTCEHASSRLPPGVRRRRGEGALLDSHWGWDIGAWAVSRELARQLGTTAVGGRWTRLWVDLNRNVEDETLIRSAADGEILSWNRELTLSEREQRIVHCHRPYHREIDRQIRRRVARGVRPLVFAVHSYTPVMRGRERPYEIGVLYEHHPRPAYRLGRSLREHGLRVRYNEPYSGRRGMMYSADRHGSRHGLPALELELNQALFEDPSAARRLGVAVAGALNRIMPEERSG